MDEKTLGRVGSISRKPVPTPRSTLRKPAPSTMKVGSAATPSSADDILSALEGIPGVGSLRSLNKTPKSPTLDQPDPGGQRQGVPQSTSINSLPAGQDNQKTSDSKVLREDSSQSLRLPHKKDDKVHFLMPLCIYDMFINKVSLSRQLDSTLQPIFGKDSKLMGEWEI